MLNTYVLSLVLKVSNDVVVLMLVGNAFQIWGLILVKDELCTNVVLALATGSLFDNADLNCLLWDISMSSLRYGVLDNAHIWILRLLCCTVYYSQF